MTSSELNKYLPVTLLINSGLFASFWHDKTVKKEINNIITLNFIYGLFNEFNDNKFTENDLENSKSVFDLILGE